MTLPQIVRIRQALDLSRLDDPGKAAAEALGRLLARTPLKPEIGRASGRERV